MILPTNLIRLTATILALSVPLSGCSPVSPWERGTLAKPEMAVNPQPQLNAFREHIFNSKEASQGGHSGAGGGCGCN